MMVFSTPKIVISTWLDSEAPRAVKVALRTPWERRTVFETVEGAVAEVVRMLVGGAVPISRQNWVCGSEGASLSRRGVVSSAMMGLERATLFRCHCTCRTVDTNQDCVIDA